jgi:hypothetical protein
MNSLDPAGGGDQGLAAADRLQDFRGEWYQCLGRRADELFELTDALLCAEGPVKSLVGCAWSRSIAAGTAPSTTL